MATLEQIQARMKKLQAQAEALLAKRAQAAVDQIRELMIKHGLTTEDIEARAKARREAKAAGRRLVNGVSKAAKSAKGKMPAKYRDPKTGATWSGHARPPAWIKDVKDRSRFLINGAASAAHEVASATRPAAKARKAAAKKASAVKAVAKKTVKKTVVKAAAVKKTAAKKVGATKVTAKKAVAKKASAAKPRAASSAGVKKAGRPKAAAKKSPGRKAASQAAASTAAV
ncbi:H-NS family nucleoid-associated regulatory protein [Paraburkholderia sp. DHOC27]|uniref:H-NS histone family protein n=1 Tax=Paraburkholderia sp. DHOC27 TaxID=2303330 RepID=UPI000E3E5CA1|nr:H-NS histone family protein [Paraburkholderia sp. DHOC27]RFU45124.1 H-NS histone family protein [Paraburkholderia sp. DHOC27]